LILKTVLKIESENDISVVIKSRFYFYVAEKISGKMSQGKEIFIFKSPIFLKKF